jgi:hypothetical protein
MAHCESHKRKNKFFFEKFVPFTKFALANLSPLLPPMIARATKKPFPSLLHFFSTYVVCTFLCFFVFNIFLKLACDVLRFQG